MSQPHDHWTFTVKAGKLHITCACPGEKAPPIPISRIRGFRCDAVIGGHALIIDRSPSVTRPSNLRLIYDGDLSARLAAAELRDILGRAGWRPLATVRVAVTCKPKVGSTCKVLGGHS